jgi:hypothetical protein
VQEVDCFCRYCQYADQATCGDGSTMQLCWLYLGTMLLLRLTLSALGLCRVPGVLCFLFESAHRVMVNQHWLHARGCAACHLLCIKAWRTSELSAADPLAQTVSCGA